MEETISYVALLQSSPVNSRLSENYILVNYILAVFRCEENLDSANSDRGYDRELRHAIVVTFLDVNVSTKISWVSS